MENVSSRCGKSDNAPRLRFPEFSGEWLSTTLGAIGTFTKGAPLSKADIASEGTPFILYGELYTTYKEVTTEIKRRTLKTANDECMSRVGDVIIPTSGETPDEIATATCIMVSNVILAGDLNIYRNSTIDGRFISYIINHVINGDISRIAQGKSVVHIKASELAKLRINYPSRQEQNKIIDFLMLLNRKIAKQQSLINALKTYKRGVMNKLFDENIEFDKYLKWEKVEEIFKTINDKPYQVQSCSYFQNGLYDIVDQGKKEIVGFCDYNDKLFIDVPVIIYGDHTTLVKYREKKFIVGGDGVKLLKSRDSNINLKYLYYALLRYNIKLEGYKRHFSILKEVSLPIFEKCIQDEIAKIMTCIDSYIKLHENKLSSLLSLKSSLLQKMFI